ncbi:MAG: hypothetical protein QOI88_4154 [Gammaproteobacteria bacterium]|jgi:hypothetical protein|nr:hypothetical protein [Gammaproteobacteria bacterium]
MNATRDRVVLAGVASLAVASSLPPLSTLLVRFMLTQMLVQIPVIFLAAASLSAQIRLPTQTRWMRWNAQGAPGLLFSAIVLAFWMTPIALDGAAADSLWETGKIVSVVTAGISAGISWRLGSGVAHAFYVGNMVWMTVTAGMLYQESTERLCNAYLWDDQAITGQALVGVSVVLAVTWMLEVAGRNLRPLPRQGRRSD